ncbi:hypothetical protein TWF694_008924 [Orbilia ellipsospora]|uniref:Uncharacterized protein n=1 Tax=Orbilia ellipsospora TaxID=2528407 RepID=A0AAV9XE28_9PEZI
MSPIPTVTPSGSPQATATPMAESSSSDPQRTGLIFDVSSIAAVVLGIILFFTIVGLIVHCIRFRRARKLNVNSQIPNVGSTTRGHWNWATGDLESGLEKPKKRESLIQTYVKRLSVTRSPPGIDINKISHPKLIQCSQDPQFPSLPEPKAAFIRTYNISAPSSLAGSQKNSIDLAPERPPIKIKGSPVIGAPKAPTPALKIDTRKRPNPPKLSIPGGSQVAGNSIASTTVAGLTTSIYVPPTPSKTKFPDGPLSPRFQTTLAETKFSKSDEQTPSEYFSAEDTRPRERYRFSDPTTPTPASQTSVRSLSWNGLPKRNGVIPLNSPMSPRQLKTPNVSSPRHNWIPVDVERVSMQTHPNSRIVSFASQVQQIRSKSAQNTSQGRAPTGGSRSASIPIAREDDIVTDDEASVIDYSDESEEETSETMTPNIYTHNNRSSVRTGHTASTRFSQDSIPNPPLTPFFGEFKGSPFSRSFFSRNGSRPRIPGDGTPRRTLSSPGLEIVTRPGDESPPLSPVTFRIDNNPLATPKTPKLPFTVDPHDRIDADGINDGTYPIEWRNEMERQALEDVKTRRQAIIRQQTITNTLQVPDRFPKKKGVSFRLSNHNRGQSDERPILPKIDTHDISIAESIKKARPSWYGLRTDDSDISMI